MKYCVKSVRIRSYAGLYFPAFGLNTERYEYSVRMRKNADQNNSEYGYFSHSDGMLYHSHALYHQIIFKSKDYHQAFSYLE